MEGKDVSGFKLACTKYLITLDLGSLRIYGRELQIRKPTTMKKAELIEEIIKVLCGEVIPRRNNRGAPVKTAYIDKDILKTVARLQKEFLKGEREACGEQTERKALVLADSLQENSVEPLQFTIRFSCLNEEQRKLLYAFLNSL